MSDEHVPAESLKTVAERLTRRYAEDPNIMGVGWGRAFRGGRLTTEQALVFVVREKLDEADCEARGTTLIPGSVEGMPTDVIERGRIARAATMAGSRDDTQYDPLLGGVASANLEQLDRTFFWSAGGRGTLGILCKDGQGRDMALSNWHVWADNGALNGDRIVQPGTPGGGDYAEGIATSALCGPLLGSFFEGRVPSGLAAGLYAGAGAAAIAAALSDDIDPFRRGQDATPEAEEAVTHKETLSVALTYRDQGLGAGVLRQGLPWPGRPFDSEVKWKYTRHTNLALMGTDADEVQPNKQVLAGYAVATDLAAYHAGDRIVVSAAIWDPQHRPADAYHVVAQLVCAAEPNRHLRLVLHPATCQGLNLAPPAKGERVVAQAVSLGRRGQICVNFGYYALDGVLDRAYNFGPLAAAYWAGPAPLRMAPLPGVGTAGLFVPDRGVVFRHAPAPRVVIRLAHESTSPVQVTAVDAFDQEQDVATAPAKQGKIHEITLKGEMITEVRITGGENTVVVERYCFVPTAASGEPEPGVVEPDGVPAAVTQGLVVPAVTSVGELSCTDFSRYAAGTAFPRQHQFGVLEITALDGNRQRIVDWSAPEPNSLLFSEEGIRVEHAPTRRVWLRVGQFTSAPIEIRALDANGDVVATATKATAHTIENIELTGAGIVAVEITGGGHEAILVRYCVGARDDADPKGPFRHCFRGAMPLPTDAPRGRWIVYLAVQNVNHVPPGVPPDQAATVIGGHVMGPTAQVLGCGFMLLGDHVFDIF
jgi:hypothetical protein